MKTSVNCSRKTTHTNELDTGNRMKLESIMYEDELPDEMTQEQYDAWYEKSFILGGRVGVRVGPMFVCDP